MNKNFPVVETECDVCVIGGGMAGLTAAVAAARNGSKTVLLHDRPVLGGNASSEVRMWICGARGSNKKETGILEEVQLDNCRRNSGGNFSLWDSILWEKAAFTPGLTSHLNCTVHDAELDGRRIVSVKGWQMTTQTWHVVRARTFIDCSGDSVLAPISGASFRRGREACDEFGEDIEPSRADDRTMGNTVLLQLREHPEPQEFTAPRWAHYFDDSTHLPTRLGDAFGTNFWWLELGGLQDTIGEAEEIHRELNRMVYGVWDYMKNRGPNREKLRNWALDFVGATAGKRENRRYVGPYIMTQNDVRAGGRFDDIIAYGGWSMDDHHPGGMLYPGKPTLFHAAPSPYGIPYRSIYSIDVPNLLFAGRNISVTHAALSSTRVMATCAVIGQAAGTAAALCTRHGCDPADLYPARVPELQAILMDDDCWLPGRAREVSHLAREAEIEAGDDAEQLRDGHDRPLDDGPHGWIGAIGETITFFWKKPVALGGLRMVFDSDLNNAKKQPCRFPLGVMPLPVPPKMIRAFRVEVRLPSGDWEIVREENDNWQRLLHVPVDREVTAVRLTPLATWGHSEVRIFSIDPIAASDWKPKISALPQGHHWNEMVAQVPATDLAPPESGLEGESRGSGKIGA